MVGSVSNCAPVEAADFTVFPGEAVFIRCFGEVTLTRLAPDMGTGTAVVGTVVKNVTNGCDPGQSDTPGTAAIPGGKFARLIAFAPTGSVDMSGREPSLFPDDGWIILPVDESVCDTVECLGSKERRPGADECCATTITTGG